MKTFAALLLTAAVATTLPGCSTMAGIWEKIEAGAAQNRLQAYQAVEDKTLLAAFYELSPDGRNAGVTKELRGAGFAQELLQPNAYALAKQTAYSVSPDIVADKMVRYDYDSTNDVPARLYINTAKKRGNTVKLYKPAMSAHINRALGVPFQHIPATAKTRASVEWYDLDNVLVEYERGGRIVSVMVRAHQLFAAIGADTTMYTSIHFGPGVGRRVENSIRNSLFAEYYIRDL